MADRTDIEFLSKTPTVLALPPWQQEAVAELAEPLRVKKGAKLIERGSDDGFTYFLTAGKVSLQGVGAPPEIVEAGTPSAQTPLANLRPRILDVKAMGRVQAIRVPDILLNQIECGKGQLDPAEVTDDDDGEEKRREAAGRLPFELYRDLKNGESSVLPSLPDTAVRIQLAIEDDLSDADAVARIAATDPAIAAKLIKTANSALYGGRTAVETCTAAVVRLGLETTRQLVLTFALKEVFRTRDKSLRARMKDLWDHSVHIAAMCFVLARQVQGLNPEEALLVGLIHDIGTIAVINYAARNPELAADPAALERTISCMRGGLGVLIMREWKFAPAFADAARDAECWLREHEGAADFTDLLIVAQVHERLRRNDTEGLPRLEEIPAFTKVLGEDASPKTSVAVMNQTEALVEVIRSVLSR